MPTKLSTPIPYNDLQNDLYSLDLFDRELDGSLSIYLRDDVAHILLIERKFPSLDGDYINAGFYLVQVLETVCSERELTSFRSRLEFFVKEEGRVNFMEIDAILIAPDFLDVVIKFAREYGELERRKPIELYVYEED